MTRRAAVIRNLMALTRQRPLEDALLLPEDLALTHEPTMVFMDGIQCVSSCPLPKVCKLRQTDE